MNYFRVAQLLVNTPLAIHEQKLMVILDAVLPRLTGQEFEIGDDEDLIPEKKQLVMPDESGLPSVAVIPIIGTLVNRTIGMQALSGLMSYHAIRAQVQFALDSPGIQGIALDMDSSGGDVNGLLDTADFLRKAASIKPMIALVDEQAFSAAYMLASAARTVIVPRTGGVGSVGVLAVHVDQSALDQQEGLKYTFVTSGTRKADYNSHMPLSTVAQQELQARVNEVYELMADTVAEYRRVPRKVLDTLQGGVVFGQEAVDLGLATRVQSKEDAMQEFMLGLTRQSQSLLVGSPSFNQGGHMAKSKTIIVKSTSPGTPVNEPEVGEVQGQQEQNPDPEEVQQTEEVSAIAQGANVSGKTVQRDIQKVAEVKSSFEETMQTSYVMDVLGACRLAGRPELAEKFIAKRISLASVRSALLNAQAEADEAIKIVGMPPSESQTEKAKAVLIDAHEIFAARRKQMAGSA